MAMMTSSGNEYEIMRSMLQLAGDRACESCRYGALAHVNKGSEVRESKRRHVRLSHGSQAALPHSLVRLRKSCSCAPSISPAVD